jgi:hypothetical protein
MSGSTSFHRPETPVGSEPWNSAQFACEHIAHKDTHDDLRFIADVLDVGDISKEVEDVSQHRSRQHHESQNEGTCSVTISEAKSTASRTASPEPARAPPENLGLRAEAKARDVFREEATSSSLDRPSKARTKPTPLSRSLSKNLPTSEASAGPSRRDRKRMMRFRCDIRGSRPTSSAA